MTTKNNAKEAMTAAMANLDAQIAALLAQKATIASEFAIEGERNWGYVGDVNHIADQIEAAVDPVGFDARTYR